MRVLQTQMVEWRMNFYLKVKSALDMNCWTKNYLLPAGWYGEYEVGCLEDSTRPDGRIVKLHKCV